MINAKQIAFNRCYDDYRMALDSVDSMSLAEALENIDLLYGIPEMVDASNITEVKNELRHQINLEWSPALRWYREQCQKALDKAEKA